MIAILRSFIEPVRRSAIRSADAAMQYIGDRERFLKRGRDVALHTRQIATFQVGSLLVAKLSQLWTDLLSRLCSTERTLSFVRCGPERKTHAHTQYRGKAPAAEPLV